MGHDFSQYAPVGKAEAARMQAAEAARAAAPATSPDVLVVPVASPSPVGPVIGTTGEGPGLHALGGFTQLAPAPVAVPAPVAPKPAPPVFVGGRERSAVFPLDCPLSYDGRLYDAVVMRRPTAREVGAFYDALAEGGFQGFPIFFTPEGDPIPHAVIDALDPDDDDRIMGRLMDFLPRRLRLAAGESDPGSLPPTGAPTAPTSST
ncbi:phage tail assembly protein [Methylobacterium oryzihabitans]|uniref:phage tail assembly protein n=1 Tax=Methylobacterium oryzihabitans TaxID=2499852 RepID=UPI0016524416|nr:phage tail assembly protein [Methylobacterium oryzihabitans]